jgi:hypothetical protein
MGVKGHRDYHNLQSRYPPTRKSRLGLPTASKTDEDDVRKRKVVEGKLDIKTDDFIPPSLTTTLQRVQRSYQNIA